MGILNVTPDSFSDGGKHYTPELAVERALRMEDEGANIIDIGGESTRPYAQPVSPDEEVRRVAPVMEKLQQRLSIPISIDTSKATVAQAAISLGAEIVNDITGLEKDPEMIDVVVQSGVGVCAMHIQGTPQTMQDNPTYQDVTQEIYEYLLKRDRDLLAAGILADKICLDPGVGFGKTHEHNIELVRNAGKFLELQRPILVGHSRKGFIVKILGDKSIDRTAGTLSVSLILAQAGIQILRVHDVAVTKQALLTFAACGGLD
jgi:dihydropteroate synthase